MVTEQPRSAGVRREERLAAGEGTAGIVRRAKAELSATWRVYVKDWIVVWTEDEEGTCTDHFVDRYLGRVVDEDVELALNPLTSRWDLRLRLWNVASEWKNEGLANACRTAMQSGRWSSVRHAEVEVVPRNSRREHVLAQYGKLKLPDAPKAAQTS